MIDGVAPTVTVNQGAGQADPTNVSPVSFDVVFSEPVTGFDASGVTIGGTASTGAPTVTPLSSTNYTITVPVLGDGTITASIAANKAHDVANNGNTASTSTDNSVTLDTTPRPSSPSTVPVRPRRTRRSVQFTVTFSEAVSGVDATDFVTAQSGVSGSSVTNVSGSGASYTVTVNTGSGDGTVALNLVDDDSIHDLVGYPLAGAGVGNGNFAGQAYTIDKTAPATPSITASNPVSPSSNASPSLSGATDPSTTVKIYNNATCTTQVGSGSDTLFTSTGITATATPNSTTSFYVTATDSAGNVSGCSTPAFTYLHDNTAPTVINVTSPVTNGTYGIGAVIPVTVQFSEPVNVTGTPQLTLSTGTPSTTAVNYTGGTGTDTLTFTYTVVSGNSSADLNYAATTSLALNSGTIKDLVGNSATLTLPATGAANSLGGNKNIVVSTAAGRGSGSISVAPGSVTAGSTGNTLTFTFTAPAGQSYNSGSTITVQVPSGWTTPQTSNAANPGFVSVATVSGTSCVPGTPAVSGTGPWTITVAQTCANSDAMSITYGGGTSATKVTAPTTAGTATFATNTKQGSGGTLTPVNPAPTVAINPGPATNINFQTSPVTTTAGATLAATTVRIRDQFNNVVTSDNTTNITVAITTNSGTAGATLSGTKTRQAQNGVVTFNDLSIDKSGTAYSLTATSSPSFGSATSGTFNINAGTPTQFAITSVNGGVTPTAGASFPVTVQSQDTFGNASNVTTSTGFTVQAYRCRRREHVEHAGAQQLDDRRQPHVHQHRELPRVRHRADRHPHQRDEPDRERHDHHRQPARLHLVRLHPPRRRRCRRAS